MDEIRFTNENNVKKLKDYVAAHFNGQQLEHMVAVMYMYIEIFASEEMSNRIHAIGADPLTEIKMKGVAECAAEFNKFLKFSGQKQ